MLSLLLCRLFSWRRPRRRAGKPLKPDVTSADWRKGGFQNLSYPGPGKGDWGEWIVRARAPSQGSDGHSPPRAAAAPLLAAYGAQLYCRRKLW